MMYYSEERYRRTHKKVDYHSLKDTVDKALSIDYECRAHKADYSHRYDEELTHLANLAGLIWNDMERTISLIGETLPFRRCKFWADDEITGSGIIWFNCAIACLPDSNLYTALSNEDEYAKIQCDNPWHLDDKERQARRNAIMRLPKDQILLLLLSVCGLVARISELQSTTAMLGGLIDELEYQHNVIVEKDGGVVYHPSAFL